jgi:hypothetical protein
VKVNVAVVALHRETEACRWVLSIPGVGVSMRMITLIGSRRHF